MDLEKAKSMRELLLEKAAKKKLYDELDGVVQKKETGRDPGGSKEYWTATGKGLIARWNIQEEDHSSIMRYCKLVPADILQRAIDETEQRATINKCGYFFKMLYHLTGSARAQARRTPPVKKVT